MWGSIFLMRRRLHLTRSCDSSPDNIFSLWQVIPDVVQPPPLRSSSPSFRQHLHHHHSLPYIFLFFSQYMPLPLKPTFLHFLGYFSPFSVHLILSFLILSSLVTPLSYPNILISATSSFFSCAFFTAHVYAPYIRYSWLSNVFFGRTEPSIPSSSFSILIVSYASSPHPSLHSLPMSPLDI